MGGCSSDARGGGIAPVRDSAAHVRAQDSIGRGREVQQEGLH